MLTALLLACAASQSDTARAEDILSRAAKVLKDAATLRLDAESEAKGQAQRARSSILLRRPNLVRWEEYSGNDLSFQTVLDGRTVWTYYPKLKGYIKEAQEDISASYLIFPLSLIYFEGDPKKILAAVTDVRVKSERLGDAPCEIIEWTAGSATCRLWVDDKNLIRRYDQKVTLRGKAYPEQTQHFRRFDAAPKVAQDAFTFAPPKDAQLIEEKGGVAEGRPRTVIAQGKGSPEEIRSALDWLESAAKRLSAAKTIRYRIGWTQKSSDSMVKVVARRPIQARYEMVDDDEDEKNASFGLLDGRDYWGFDKKGESYITLPQTSLPAKFAFDPVLTLYLGGTTKDLLVSVENLRFRQETLDQTCFAVVTWRVKFTSGLVFAFWIDDGKRIRMVEKLDDGEVLDRLQYSDYEDDAKVADEVFQYRPPAGAKCLYSGADHERRLLAVGSRAPDFEATDIAGKVVRLSDFKDKVVLLHVWEFP